MEKIKIGSIFNTHGLKGELKVKSFSDFNEERFKQGSELLIESNHDIVPVCVKSYRVHQGVVLVTFEGLEDINLVEKYKGCNLFIDKKNIHDLDDGVYFFDLKGCEVFDEKEQLIGIVEDVLDTGANPILRINKTILIPYVDAFVKSVDTKNKKIIIETIEGLL